MRDTGDHVILVTFSTGETRLVDCTELFLPPAFACLANKDAFGTMEARHGVLTWLDGKVDITPEGSVRGRTSTPPPRSMARAAGRTVPPAACRGAGRGLTRRERSG